MAIPRSSLISGQRSSTSGLHAVGSWIQFDCELDWSWTLQGALSRSLAVKSRVVKADLHFPVNAVKAWCALEKLLTVCDYCLLFVLMYFVIAILDGLIVNMVILILQCKYLQLLKKMLSVRTYWAPHHAVYYCCTEYSIRLIWYKNTKKCIYVILYSTFNCSYFSSL